MVVGSGRPFNRQRRAEPENQDQSEFGFARGPITRLQPVDPRRSRRRAGRKRAPSLRSEDHACLFSLVKALHGNEPIRHLTWQGEIPEWDRAHCLAAVAHDVRGALANIAGLAEILGDESPERSRQLASRIVTLAYDVTVMMRELIDSGRPDCADEVIHPSDVCVRTLLAECGADTEVQCRRKGLTFQAELPVDAVIEVDRIKLTRVVHNLLSNAVRYTERGGVILSASLTPAELRIVVRDTGIGIAPTELGTVFQPYRRLPAAAALAPDGAGLGLATVSRLCALLGAEIEAESTPGVGSRFVVTVPRSSDRDGSPLHLDRPLPAA